eukprot:COSAG02_NODE_59193_length_275_cov_0.579545_1_plen_77_part_01
MRLLRATTQKIANLRDAGRVLEGPQVAIRRGTARCLRESLPLSNDLNREAEVRRARIDLVVPVCPLNIKEARDAWTH